MVTDTSNLHLLEAGQPYERYRWRQLPSGLWERDIDECEQFYAFFCRYRDDPQRASFPVTCCASFSTTSAQASSAIEDAFQYAWASLRAECPALASWIEFDKESASWKKVYMPFRNERGMDDWQASTFHVVKAISGETWFNSEPPTCQLPNVFLIRHDASSAHDGEGSSGEWRGSVAIRSPHDIVDGIGMLQLLSRLLELVADRFEKGSSSKLEWAKMSPEETEKLLPLPMRVTTGIDPVPAPGLQEKWSRVQTQNQVKAMENPLLGVGLSTDDGRLTASESFHRASTTLSKATTTKLMQTCKSIGVTVTHGLSAAIVIALRDLQSPGDELGSIFRYTNSAMINLRHLMCESSGDKLALRVGNYHMIAAQTTAVDVPSASGVNSAQERFVSVATQFRDYYQSVRPDKTDGAAAAAAASELLGFAPLTWEAYTPKKTIVNNPVTPAAAASTKADVAVSSLGKIGAPLLEDRFGPCLIDNVWVAGVGLGTGVSMFLGGWNGQVEVSCVYGTAFHTRASIVRLLEMVVSSLNEALELE
jgi:hypothetical protein